MKRNNLITWLLGVLALLLVAVVVRDFLLPKLEKETSYVETLPKITTDALTEISAQKATDNITVTKNGNGWVVNNYPANTSTIEALAKALLTPEKPELVAETSRRHEDLGVASTSGTLVTLKAGETPAAFIIGNPAGKGYYVRLQNDDKVYRVEGIPSQAVSFLLNDWVDLTLASIVETSLKSIAIDRATGTDLNLTRSGEDWSTAGVGAVDTAPLSSLLTTLAAFKATSVVSDTQVKLGQPVLTVTATTDNGEAKLSFYKQGTTYYVTNQNKPGIYETDETTYKNFDILPSQLKPKPSPSLTPTS